MVTWKQLTEAEPKLAALQTEARGWRKRAGRNFCANAVWYGHGRNGGAAESLRARLIRLVGFERAEHPVLGSCEAYDVAYRTICRALPDCGPDCCCL
jgi:hypothetical protein